MPSFAACIGTASSLAFVRGSDKQSGRSRRVFAPSAECNKCPSVLTEYPDGTFSDPQYKVTEAVHAPEKKCPRLRELGAKTSHDRTFSRRPLQVASRQPALVVHSSYYRTDIFRGGCGSQGSEMTERLAELARGEGPENKAHRTCWPPDCLISSTMRMRVLYWITQRCHVVDSERERQVRNV